MRSSSARRLCIRPSFTLLATAVAAFVAGCATPPAPSASAAAPSAAPAAAPSAAASGATPLLPPSARPAGTPTPFAEVTRGAKSTDGYFPVWTKDDKTWLEIPADKLNQPFFFSFSRASGLGEAGIYPGLMGGAQMAVLRRVGNTVQLVALNDSVRGGTAGSPLARAIGESYSDSLLGAAPLLAAPRTDGGALLVDAQVLLGADFAGDQTRLEAVYRLPYALDRANSSIERVRTLAGGTSITMRSHFAIGKMPAPPAFNPGSPPNPASQPRPPEVVPEARSLFLAYTYTLAPLPAQPMQARLADQRVGFFTEAFRNYSADDTGDRRTHFIRRWRLEKKDPAAAVSEPKEPIRVVMDRNIPEKWRGPVRDGILEWNKAFERAGFRNAIVVEQQAADADWTALEGTRFLAVRWFAIEGPGATAVGPSLSDPRTGEQLRAAAIIPENWVRIFRTRAIDLQPRLGGTPNPAADIQPHAHSAHSGLDDNCTVGLDALDDATFSAELLQLRGELDPYGPEADRFIMQALKDVTMHEVGHTLGLRHNFKASTGITQAQLRDPAFTAANGVSNSVMDYNALNLSMPNEPLADYHMGTLGAYDYWAIEYGYREFTPQTEKAELAKLADRSATDARLIYATDEDNSSIDPNVNQRDLGDDPLAFAARQMALAKELWTRTQQRVLPADDDMSVYRRNLVSGLNSIAASTGLATHYLGGTYTSRALAGSRQPLLVPVPADKQRAALDLVVNNVFSSASFRFDPKFMARLGVDQLDRTSFPRSANNPDFNLNEAVLAIQRNALDALMSDSLAARLANAEVRAEDPRTLLSYADVQTRLSGAVWSELKAGRGAGRDVDSMRRGLQREHLRRLATGLLRPQSSAAADVRAVNRLVAMQLETQLKAAVAAGGWSTIVQAHLADSLAVLGEALRAPLTKQQA